MIDFTKRQKKLKNRQEEERNTLRYKKLIAETVKLILKNDNQILTNNDIKTISLSIYKSYNKLKHVRVRNLLSQEIVKADINSELQRILTDRGIKPIEKIIDLTLKGENVAKTTSDYLQTAKAYREIADFDNKSSVKARYSETTDFSKLGKDGQPAQKVTKTLEITKNEAIRDDMSNDLNKVNDSVSPENDDLDKG